jgi:hypothetical protein
MMIGDSLLDRPRRRGLRLFWPGLLLVEGKAYLDGYLSIQEGVERATHLFLELFHRIGLGSPLSQLLQV